jgi:chemotaxis protein CheC
MTSVAERNLIEAGAQEAARAMALLLRRPVAVRSIETASLDAIAHKLGPRALVVGFTVSGGLPGKFALATSEENAGKLAHDLVGKSTLDKKSIGALTELGNIGASAFLNGVARALDTACVPSVPSVIVDEPKQALAGFDVSGELAVAELDAGVILCFVR